MLAKKISKKRKKKKRKSIPMECDTDPSKKEYYRTNLKVFFLIHPSPCPFTKGVHLARIMLQIQTILQTFYKLMMWHAPPQLFKN